MPKPTLKFAALKAKYPHVHSFEIEDDHMRKVMRIRVKGRVKTVETMIDDRVIAYFPNSDAVITAALEKLCKELEVIEMNENPQRSIPF